MGQPHKHAELIKAWADGAEIQYFSSNGCWYNVAHPDWSNYIKYRIRQTEKKPVVRWLWVDENNQIMSVMQSEEEVPHGLTKLEWSRTEFPE